MTVQCVKPTANLSVMQDTCGRLNPTLHCHLGDTPIRSTQTPYKTKGNSFSRLATGASGRDKSQSSPQKEREGGRRRVAVENKQRKEGGLHRKHETNQQARLL
jgi:hypothetical protein